MPTVYHPDREREGVALCLSGGGFRATLFHLGALRRLAELGVLRKITAFVSVSGGSILNGVLACRWKEASDFERAVAAPIRAFCSRDTRTRLLLHPLSWFSGATKLLARVYAARLALDVPLESIAGVPRFVFCATNLQAGVNWEFGDGRMGDYVTGRVSARGVTVAQAVAASSAFPMVFPPLVVGRVPLTDGGVYDNMGLEPVWKSHRIVLVSDAGKPFQMLARPGRRLLPRLQRSFDIGYNQSAALRKRWLIAEFQRGVMTGTYWGIGGNFEDYHFDGARGYEREVVELFKRVRTDLNAFSDAEIACLENHGYALGDVAVRKWVARDLGTSDAEFRWPRPELAGAEAASAALANSHRRTFWRDLRRAVFG